MFADLALVCGATCQLKQLTGLCATLYGNAQVPSQQTCNQVVISTGYKERVSVRVQSYTIVLVYAVYHLNRLLCLES